MKISSVKQFYTMTFKASCSDKIQKQFENGKDSFKSDEKALIYYLDRINEIKTTAPDIIVDSLIIANSNPESIGRPTVILRNNRGEFKFATTKNPHSEYKQSIKTIQLATLDGITGLCEAIKKLASN